MLSSSYERGRLRSGPAINVSHPGAVDELRDNLGGEVACQALRITSSRIKRYAKILKAKKEARQSGPRVRVAVTPSGSGHPH